jgi:hypothetical protein
MRLQLNPTETADKSAQLKCSLMYKAGARTSHDTHHWRLTVTDGQAAAITRSAWQGRSGQNWYIMSVLSTHVERAAASQSS